MKFVLRKRQFLGDDVHGEVLVSGKNIRKVFGGEIRKRIKTQFFDLRKFFMQKFATGFKVNQIGFILYRKAKNFVCQ